MNRRDFLERALAFSAAGLIVPESLRLGGLLNPSSAEAADYEAPFNGRVLIWLNLEGGNDGLNMVVPYTNSTYYSVRPSIAIPPGQVVPLSATRGFHPSLQPLAPIWDAGKLAVIEGVGYPNMNLSHFRGSDIWFSGSAEDVLWETGWLARYLETMYPDFPTLLPEAPFGLQQASNHRIPLQGTRGLTGIIVGDPSSFYYLVNENYPGGYTDNLPNTHGGTELSFMRNLDRITFDYAAAIQAAADGGQNTVAYPQTYLGSQMQIVAKLLSGGLKTPVFLCSEGSFDTHAYQTDAQGNLLASVGQSIAAFWSDMANQGFGDKVTIITTSEFGRRVEENGSYGTDHGTSAPHMVISNSVNGGIYGSTPDLLNLDEYGNLLIQNDYRSVVGSVLRGHFGASNSVLNSVFGGSFPALPLLQTTTDAGEQEVAFTDRLHAPSPNPYRGSAGQPLDLRFELARPSNVTLRVFDTQGRMVAKVAEGTYGAGSHRVAWRPSNLPAGSYHLRMEQSGGRPRNAKLIVLP